MYEAWEHPSTRASAVRGSVRYLTPHSPARVNTRNSARGPLLLISGKKDHTVPDIVTHPTSSQYPHSMAMTDLRCLAGCGHSLTIDSGWREVADTALNWLKAHML